MKEDALRVHFRPGDKQLAESRVVINNNFLGRPAGRAPIAAILDQQQTVIKNLGEGIGRVPGVSGGAIMSDGRISLILDVAGLIKITSDNDAVSRDEEKAAAELQPEPV